MKKFKKLTYFLPLLVLPFLIEREERQLVSKNIEAESKREPLKPESSSTARLPASEVKRSEKEPALARISQSIRDDFELSPEVELTKGTVLIKNVGAIAKKNYHPSLGDIIYQDKNYVFLKAEPGHKLFPVALSKSTGKLHPISYVLHIKNAAPADRGLLRNEGYKEFYYHSGIKLLSIESSPGLVLQDYSVLKSRGYSVQLEVLKDRHQTI